MTLRSKLLLFVAVPVLVAYVIGVGIALAQLRLHVRDDVENRLVRVAGHAATEFDAALREVARSAEVTAALLETFGMSGFTPSAGQLDSVLRRTVGDHAICYGAAIAFEPGAFEGRPRFAPYAYREGDALASLDIGTEAYDYADGSWEWYSAPRDRQRATWTAPYFDEGAGNILMCTFSAPFSGPDGFRGVATADIALAPLRQVVASASRADATLSVLTRDGQYVYHDDAALIMGTLEDRFTALGREGGERERRALTTAVSGLVVLGAEAGGDERWIAHAPIASTGWIAAAATDASVAMAPVRAQIGWLAGLFGATLLVMLLTLWFVADHVSRPVKRLRRAVERIAGGQLDGPPVPVEGSEEVADLARSFNRMTTDLRTNVQTRAAEQSASRDAVIFALARLAESRDEDTGKHLERICRYCEVLARAMQPRFPQIDEAWIRTITMTAALHDIGKVGVPDAVLKKKGKLTADEYKVIQSHTTIGGDTLFALRQRWTETAFVTTATQIAFAHHEKWDGSGYPFGLSGEDIALEARITALADVYDALTMKRVYKPALPHDEATRIIREGRGTHFDPVVVDAFDEVEEQFRRISEELGG